MTPFNIFLLIVALVAALLGFRSGFIKQVGSIAGIMLGIVACRLFGPQAEAWLASVMSPDTSATVVMMMAYAGLFIVAYAAASVVAYLIVKVVHVVQLGMLDRLCGALFKALVWLFVVSIVLNLWCSIAPEMTPQGIWAERVLALAPAVLGCSIG